MNTLDFPTTNFSRNSTLIVVESWFIPVDLLMILCLIVTIPLDCLFLLIIILDKACHIVPMILIANTCLAQLVTSINELFLSIFTLQNDLQHVQYADSLCVFRGYFGYVTVGIMNYSFMLQALYRYITAVYPNRLFWQTHRTQIILMCASWIFCSILSLPCLFNHNIVYNVENQVCLVPLGPDFCVIYLTPLVYLSPVSIIIFLYLKLVRHVKAMNNRVTPANVLFRAQRELKMVQQIVILVAMLLTLGIPYVLFILIAFFAVPPKHSFRIALLFIDLSFPFLVITLYQFTDPFKVFVKKFVNRRVHMMVTTTTTMNQ